VTGKSEENFEIKRSRNDRATAMVPVGLQQPQRVDEAVPVLAVGRADLRHRLQQVVQGHPGTSPQVFAGEGREH
jgi:hypothetical protein